MTDMVERVARAIDAAQRERRYGLYNYSAYPGEEPPHVVKDEVTREVLFRSVDYAEAASHYEALTRVYPAKAAIRAMREPTEAMIEDGEIAIEWDRGATGVFTAMIDTALNEKEGGE